MRIDNGANPINSHLPPTQSKASAGPSGSTNSGHTDRLLTSVDPKSLDGLLQLVASSSEIRELVVNDIKLKIQTGEYLAQQRAAETASSILNL